MLTCTRTRHRAYVSRAYFARGVLLEQVRWGDLLAWRSWLCRFRGALVRSVLVHVLGWQSIYTTVPVQEGSRYTAGSPSPSAIRSSARGFHVIFQIRAKNEFAISLKKNENTFFRGSIFQSIVNQIFSPGVVKFILYVVYVKFLYHRGFLVQKDKEKQR
jgi:hypothetical protein